VLALAARAPSFLSFLGGLVVASVARSPTTAIRGARSATTRSSATASSPVARICTQRSSRMTSPRACMPNRLIYEDDERPTGGRKWLAANDSEQDAEL
jgi:hypothetical protein